MRKRLIEKITKSKQGSLGYTLTEMLVVIGIIVILCAVAIPSVFGIMNALRFARANNYAKSIFLAAQQNLTEMRSDGGLKPVQAAGADPIPPEVTTFPNEFRAEYVYTVTGDEAFNRVLPPASIDADIRDDQIVIEYNPITGNVYAVFYYDKDKTDLDLEEKYTSNALPHGNEDKEKKARKALMVGYYDGSGLNSSQIELEQTQAQVEFINGEEGIVRVTVPIPESFFEKADKFAKALNIDLTIIGEQSDATNVNQDGTVNTLVIPIKIANDSTGYTWTTDGKSIVFEYVLDSLRDTLSFANYASNTADPQTNTPASLTSVFDETGFIYNVLPGENITITASVKYDGDGSELVKIAPGIISGVNPMFEYLQPVDGGYMLAVANGRNLQNLNAIAPSIGMQVKSVVFTTDIDWNTTVNYYNRTHGTVAGGVKSYSNTADEAPARALPYFVPIHSDSLFGTAQFIFPTSGDGISGYLQSIINSQFGAYFNLNGNVPTLTDEIDVFLSEARDESGNVKKDQNGNTIYNVESVVHAYIEGNGHKVYNINVDSTKYSIPNGNGETNKKGRFYATGDNQIVDYNFTGLFGYVNTPINGLHVVNPIVKGVDLISEEKLTPQYGDRAYFNIFTGRWEYPVIGYTYTSNFNNPATGALLGAGGYNTLITNCSTYIDKNAPGYNPGKQFINNKLYQLPYDKDANQGWYGVSGTGAVGGLVGYAKSHRTTTGVPDGDLAVLAFSNCFAAVPVSGRMQTGTNKDFGYSNGVGGFIGNSQMTNFYKCYSSGNVYAENCYTKRASLADPNWHSATFGDSRLSLLYTGRQSWGAGGFVGSSHGTRYSSCFASGDVDAYNLSSGYKKGAGGFVGQMILDGDHTYGNSTTNSNNSKYDTYIAQTTIFTDCYAVGEAKLNNGVDENFSGANGRTLFQNGIRIFFLDNVFDSNSDRATYVIGDYYRLYAPHVIKEGSVPDYTDIYVFRNSYYLADYHMKNPNAQANSNGCADPEPYATFVNLTEYHKKGSTWIKDQIAHIKEIELSIPLLGWPTGTYGSRYFPRDGSMDTAYESLFSEAYSTNLWEPATYGTTHGYDLNGIYPFMKLKGMDYYGDWPSKPSDVGIAYYESYVGDNNYYYHFDRDSTATLKNGVDTFGNPYIVDEDGFVILSASNAEMKVSFNGNVSVPMTASTETFDSRHIFRLSSAQIAEAVECLKNPTLKGVDRFYVEVTVTQDGKTYTLYFNPNVALSQVNPVEGNQSAKKPDAAPTTIYIRSARQFKAIAAMEDCWTKNTRYIQQLNIDASKYNWPTPATDANEEPIDPKKISSIGTLEQPFNATYSGLYTDTVSGQEKQYTISGFTPTEAGFFGVIGADGTVSDLIVECPDITAGSADTIEYVAVLAGTNHGTLDNVDLKLQSNVTLTAKTAAALLAGFTDGVITDCDVEQIEGKSLTITAPNAGGLIGIALGTADKKAEVTNSRLTLKSPFTANSAFAGGYAAHTTHLSVDKLNINIHSITSTTAENLGGLAGYAESSEFVGENGGPEIQINEILKSEAGKGYTAGAIASGKDVQIIAVDLNAKDISGHTAAGFLGSLTNADATNCNITITRSIVGTEGAAGVAAVVGPQSVFNKVNATLAGATVKATEGNAAGYALEIKGDAFVDSSAVNLGGYTVTKDENGKITVRNPVSFTTIEASGSAAGFAISVDGTVSYSHVVGRGKITGSDASGFTVTVKGAIGNSYVSPALTADADGYTLNNNENLRIEGSASAAGFALTLEKNGTISASYALGSIISNGTVEIEIVEDQVPTEPTGEIGETEATEETGETDPSETTEAAVPTESVTSAYGFVGTNKGTIDRCMANVELNDGFAFVGVNDSLVTTSYGWYLSKNEIRLVTGDGKCYNSYFGNIKPENAKGPCATVYDDKGECAEVTSPQLQASEIPGFRLGYDAYPYDEMTPEEYQYPMLRNHYGNWLTPPQYAYGVAYYEIYEDGSVKVRAEDLSDSTVTEEKTSLSGIYQIQTDGTLVSGVSFGNEASIDEAGYARFYNTEITGHEDEVVKLTFTLGDFTYNFYAVVPGENPIVSIAKTTSKSSTAQLDTRFADAIKVNGSFSESNETYTVRTPEQLANIGQVDANFNQTHDITADASTLTSAEIKDGRKYDGYSKVLILDTPDKAWLANVDGKVLNLNLTVIGGLNQPVINVVGETGVVDLRTVRLNEVNSGGALIGTSSGSFSSDSISITAAVNGGKIVNAITKGTFTTGTVTVTPDEQGNVPVLFGNISGGIVTGSTMNLNGGNLPVGLFQSVTNGATIEGFQITLKNLGNALLGGELSGNLNSITLNCTTANVGNSNGLIVNTMNSGSIIDCAVNVTGDADNKIVGEITTSAPIFGGITGTMIGGSITDTSVTAETIILTAANLEDDKAMFGGLVGETMATETTEENPEIIYTVLTNNTVDADFRVTGKAGKLTVVGGMVAVSNSIITNGTVDANIEYTQVIGEIADQVGIGGIIGWVQDGSLKGVEEAISVSGSIILKAPDGQTPSSTSRDWYFIGGAIGFDGGATYANISATVTIDQHWSGSALFGEIISYAGETLEEAISAVCPAGLGTVGKFVGYVSNGSNFTKCTAIGSETTAAYQFLGQVASSEATLLQDSVARSDYVESFTAESGTYEKDMSASLSEWYTGTLYQSGTPYRIFNAVLSTCAFDLVDETGNTVSYYQTLDGRNTYFYRENESLSKTIYNQKAGTPLTLTTRTITIKCSDMKSYTTETKLPYYHIGESDTKYYPVYVIYKTGSLGRITVTFTAKDAAGTVKWSQTETGSVGQIWDTVDLTQINAPASTNASYIAVSVDNSQILHISANNAIEAITPNKTANGVVYFSDGGNASTSGYTWKYSNNKITSNKTANIVANVNVILDAAYYDSAKMYAQFTIDGMGTYYLYSYSELNHWYIATLVPTGERNQICTYSVNDASIVTAELNLPGFIGEATQDAEVTEPTEATNPPELATVPPAAEDGKNH